MLWVAYQLFRDIISHYLLFWLSDSPCKSRGTEAEPWMSSFQTHMEPAGWSSRSTIHSSERKPQANGFAVLSSCSCAMFSASKMAWECCSVCGGNFVSSFWQHFLGYKHVAPSAGRQSEQAVGRGRSGLGLTTGHSIIPAPACTVQAFSVPGKQTTFAVFLMQFFSKRLYMRELHHLWQL